MRIVFECYAIYSAVMCTALTLALAVNLPDNLLESLAKRVINVSFLIYGPVMTAVCLFGLKDIKALSHMCTINGMQQKTNYVNLFVLFICLTFGVCVTTVMILERTWDLAMRSFRNENSVLYQATAFYFQYSHQNRRRRSRERRRQRQYEIMQQDIERSANA